MTSNSMLFVNEAADMARFDAYGTFRGFGDTVGVSPSNFLCDLPILFPFPRNFASH